MKMKRIDAVVRGKSTQMTEALERRASRILRNVDQAIDYAKDQRDEFCEKAEKLINSLGCVADCESTQVCGEKINLYINTVKMMNEWEASLSILEELKKKLNENVEVEEEK